VLSALWMKPKRRSHVPIASSRLWAGNLASENATGCEASFQEAENCSRKWRRRTQSVPPKRGNVMTSPRRVPSGSWPTCSAAMMLPTCENLSKKKSIRRDPGRHHGGAADRRRDRRRATCDRNRGRRYRRGRGPARIPRVPRARKQTPSASPQPSTRACRHLFGGRST
jgi:hypothetical protein